MLAYDLLPSEPVGRRVRTSKQPPAYAGSRIPIVYPQNFLTGIRRPRLTVSVRLTSSLPIQMMPVVAQICGRLATLAEPLFFKKLHCLQCRSGFFVLLYLTIFSRPTLSFLALRSCIPAFIYSLPVCTYLFICLRYII